MVLSSVKYGESEMVDAIEEGRVVRVSADYAKKEGLLVLRKVDKKAVTSPTVVNEQTRQGYKERRSLMNFEPFRKPLRTDKNDIISSLADNFHWILIRKRKERNLSRKQLAESLSVKEEDIKMIENGVLPSRDYILISQLENYFQVNLRKDSQNLSSPGIQAKKDDITLNKDKKEDDFIAKEIDLFKED